MEFRHNEPMIEDALCLTEKEIDEVKSVLIEAIANCDDVKEIPKILEERLKNNQRVYAYLTMGQLFPNVFAITIAIKGMFGLDVKELLEIFDEGLSGISLSEGIEKVVKRFGLSDKGYALIMMIGSIMKVEVVVG